ncbi:MAG: M28 family peptidase, partial [Bacteroidia bacterium]|nr:M28 family peptidase [Bacteroidia bacterium]
MEKKEQHGLWKISFFIFPVLIIFLVYSSCGPKDPEVPVPTTTANPTSTTGTFTPQKAHVDPPVFNMDSAYAFVKFQCAMGPRNPGSKAHEKCAQWLEKKLKSYGAKTTVQTSTVQTFDEKKWLCKNIIAAFNPDAKDRVLLCAHWDTRPFADHDTIEKNKTLPIIGANDGASGVGVLMEVARVMSQKKTEVGIDIILFDMEDYGNSDNEESWCLGAQYWGKNLHEPQYFAKFGILLDMVGAKGAVFPKEGSSLYYARDIVDKVWSTGQLMGFGNY